MRSSSPLRCALRHRRDDPDGGGATNVVPGATVPFDLQIRNPSASTVHIEALLPPACNSTQALSTPLASGETHLIPLQCIVPDTAGPGELTMPIEIRTDSGAEQLQASVRLSERVRTLR